MFKSATFRLTAWYLAIAMAISLSFSFVLYNITSVDLDNGLHSQGQDIMKEFPVFQNSPYLKMTPDYHSGVHKILAHLIFLNISLLIIAGFASYLLARRTLAPIEAAHEQQKRFTSDVSHELRTPLTAIKMEAEVALMNNNLKEHDLKQILASNIEEVGKLEGLINNLLRLARLETSEIQQNFTKLDANNIAEMAINNSLKTHPGRYIDIKKITPDQDAELMGDSENLCQLLVILIDNAIKYSKATTRVLVEAKSIDNNIVWLVKDKGVGISKEALVHVFDRFYREDTSRLKNNIVANVGGYGIGLSIAKMIVDIHAGRITVTSSRGVGTTVTVIIPKQI